MQHHHGGAPPPPPPPQPPHAGGVYAEHQQHQQQQQQQQAPRQDGIPYIGSRISLISKTDIRYEGFLFNIDTRQSMVALQHVRSFGTEGRRPDHIPGSDQVLPYATFKASEIKDLHVCEAAPPAAYGAAYGQAPPPPPMPQQPYQHYQQPPPPPQPPLPQAPPAPQAPRAPAPPPQSPAKKPQSPVKAKPSSGPTLLTPGSFQSKPEAPKRQEPAQQQQQQQQQQYQQQQYQQQQQQQYHQQQQVAASSASDASSNSYNNNNNNNSRGGQGQAGGSRTIPGMGNHLLKRKERRVPGGPAEGGLASVSAGLDFNFEQGLGGFDKEEEFSKLSVDDNKAKGSYQKSSFFDTISCDALDRLEGKHGRVTAHQERTLNTETFGAVGLNNNRRGYRGGRGGGGRGGGRRSNYNTRNGGGRGGNNGNRGDQWSHGVGGRNPTSA